MTVDGHRELRERIGALILGGLDEGEAAMVRAHLDGCEECRREAAELSPLAELLSRADPAQLAPPPQPPASLAGLVLLRIREERRARRRRRLRLALAGAGAALTLAAAVLAGTTLLGSREPEGPAAPEAVWVRTGEHDLSAELVAQQWGTEIRVWARGVEPGAWCRVFVRDRSGRRLAAGSFRYTRDTAERPPSLGTGLELDEIRALEIEAGNRSLVARLGRRGTGPGAPPPDESGEEGGEEVGAW